MTKLKIGMIIAVSFVVLMAATTFYRKKNDLKPGVEPTYKTAEVKIINQKAWALGDTVQKFPIKDF